MYTWGYQRSPVTAAVIFPSAPRGPVPQFQVGSWAQIVSASTQVRSWMTRGMPRPGRTCRLPGLTPETLVPLIRSCSTASVIRYPPASPAYTLSRVMPWAWS